MKTLLATEFRKPCRSANQCVHSNQMWGGGGELISVLDMFLFSSLVLSFRVKGSSTTELPGSGDPPLGRILHLGQKQTKH